MFDYLKHNYHPIFHHHLADRYLDYHSHPLSLHGPLVRVKAVIKKVEPDVHVHGVSHHHLLIDQIKVLEIKGGNASLIGSEAFVAIRYGDQLGLQGPIPNLKEGNSIEMQGEYIDENHAYPSIGNPGDPVIHFVHRPVGFIIYQGKKYE